MKKGIVIIVICTLIAAILVACGFIFNIKTVEVELQNEVTVTDETKILSHAGIEKNTNILSLDEDAVKERIENAYDGEIEVVDIVRNFPNSVLIKVRERMSVFKINVEGSTSFVLPDKDFQRTNRYTVLPVDKKYIEVSGFSVKDNFSEDECYYLRDIANVLIRCGFSEAALPFFVDKIEFSEVNITITIFDGATICVPKNNLKECLARGLVDYLNSSEVIRETFSYTNA